MSSFLRKVVVTHIRPGRADIIEELPALLPSSAAAVVRGFESEFMQEHLIYTRKNWAVGRTFIIEYRADPVLVRIVDMPDEESSEQAVNAYQKENTCVDPRD